MSEAMAGSQRNVSDSHFRDNTFINQGNAQNLTVNYGLPHRPARPEVVRVIPYPRNEDLVQRKDLVDRLNELLPTSGGGSAALWGLGGSGKTQIALEYAYQRCIADEKCCVFWVHAENEATFTSDYEAIGKELGVDDRLQGSEMLDAVRRHIESRSNWLIVIDNADDLKLFGVGQPAEGKLNLYKYTPRASQGTVLWTSRDERISGTLVGASRSIQVRSMAMDQAIALLATVRGQTTTSRETGVDSLVSELQCLPLAISQAGGFMRRMSMSAERYLELLKQGNTRWELLRISDTDRHRRPEVSNSVLETWKVSTDRIWAESKISYDVLHIIAYVDNQDLPEELLTAAANLVSAAGSKTATQLTDLEIQAVVARLRELCFISFRNSGEDKRSYEMHKLVQEALRYRLSFPSTLQSDSDVPNKDEVYYSRLALELICSLFPTPQPDSWPQCERFVNHALRVSEWAEMSNTEIETCDLLFKVSVYFDQRGRWQEESLALNPLLSLYERKLGSRHLATITAKENVAISYTKQSLDDKAEPLQQEVLRLRRELLGEKDLDTIRIMSSLAGTYCRLDRSKEAQGILEEVLEIQRDRLGPKDKRTIKSMSRLAHSYFSQGLYSEAEKIDQEVLQLRREVLGERDASTISAISHLALTYMYQRQWEKGERFVKESLELRREVLGDRHPETIRDTHTLAEAYYSQGKLDEAEPCAQLAFDLYRQVLGDGHRYTKRSKLLLDTVRKATRSLPNPKEPAQLLTDMEAGKPERPKDPWYKPWL